MKNLIILLFVLTCSVSFSAPQGDAFTYQGELRENGQQVTGVYDMAVSIFDSDMGGLLLQSDVFPSVLVENSLFTLQVDVGNIVFSGDELWLELTFTSDGVNWTTMPRQKIVNAPYALQSKFVGTNGVNSASIANNSITSDDLGNDSVTASKIADNAVLGINIADGVITKSDVDSTSVQERVVGTCAEGSSIRVIAQDGTVTCETDDAGISGWSLSGNTGTNPGTHYIGTSDDVPFIVKSNSVQIAEFGKSGNVVLGTSHSILSPFLSNITIGGGINNLIDNGGMISGSVTIGGGEGNAASSTTNNVSDSTIGGGKNNTVSREGTTISGGKNNSASNIFSAVGGGAGNIASGAYSTVAGGSGNKAGGENSFAGGITARVRDAADTGDSNGDEGTFVWSSKSGYFTSSGPNQFLIDSDEFGFGVSSPVSPFHIRAQGTSVGSASNSNEVVLTVEPETNTDDVAVVINKMGSDNESALIFSSVSHPQFDIRSNNSGSSMDINSYNGDSAIFQMRINPVASNRIDFNVNVEPQVNDDYNLGSASYRWATIYTTNVDTTNAVNVTSDKRLKDNIDEIEYGLSEILAMRPVSYSMKQDANKSMHLGLIAQEVEEIIPEIVQKKNDEMKTRSMRYSELLPVLIKATQEQQALIDQQSREIEELKKMVVRLLKDKKYDTRR